jgi:hypothetical protein
MLFHLLASISSRSILGSAVANEASQSFMPPAAASSEV